MVPSQPPEPNSPDREKRAPRRLDPSWGQLPEHADRNVLIADISDTGLRLIDGDGAIGEGDPLTVRILAGEQKPFLVKGSVIRLLENGYAIRLEDGSIADPCWVEHVRCWCARIS